MINLSYAALEPAPAQDGAGKVVRDSALPHLARDDPAEAGAVRSSPMGENSPAKGSPAWKPVTWSKWTLFVIFLLVLVSAFFIGFAQTWELLVGLESPANSSYPPLAWALSILGYLLVPALIGLVVGIGAEMQVQARLRSDEEQYAKLRELFQLPPQGDSPGDTGSGAGPAPGPTP